jgi:hypothetical protein
MVTSDTPLHFQVVLDGPTRDKIRELAAKDDRSMGSWIRLAIRERLERQTSHMTPEEADDFYEDDEPVEDIIAAFEAGEKFVTTPPVVTLDTHGLTVPTTSSGVHADASKRQTRET